jgi:hypothetical protein
VLQETGTCYYAVLMVPEADTNLNPSPADTPDPVAVQARNTPESSTAVSGGLQRARSGLVRGLLLVTGLALLKWIGLGLLTLLGYRHPATLTIKTTSLEYRGERRLMGLSLGKTRLVIPFSTIESVRLGATSPTWALVVAVAFLVIAAAAATTLIVWGVTGREVSWILLGLAVLASGVLLDGGAYLLVRRARTRTQLARLEVVAVKDRLRLTCVPLDRAEALLDQLSSRAGTKWSA